MTETYFCEECGEEDKAPPANIEKYAGPVTDIELWFCEECTRFER